MEVLVKLNKLGKTIVMVTHEPDIAQQARRIVQMRDGKVVSDRLAAEVIAEQGGRAPRKWTKGPEAEAAGTAEAEEPASTGPRVLTARLMRGVTGSFACGLISLGLWAAAILAVVLLTMHYHPQSFDPAKRQMPPVPFLAGFFASCGAALVAFVLGILAIVFAVGARKRMRAEPGEWLGGGRALAGMILGIVSVALPVVLIVANVVAAVLKGKQ